MRKINLARALKEKKRIIARVNEIVEWMKSENVHFKDETSNVDLKEKYNDLCELKSQLIELKAKIAKANAESGVARLVYEMEECKSELSMWNRVDTDTNPRRELNYGDNTANFRERVAFFDFKEVEAKKNCLRERIENLQDRIDGLNATTFIELTF